MIEFHFPSVVGLALEDMALGSVVQTEGLKSYRKTLKNGFIHVAQDFDLNNEYLKCFHQITGNTKVFINDAYHGTSTKHLQMFLSEFCYRFFRKKLHGAIFDRLLIAVAR